MKTQLFVRTPTNYCDYEQVITPAIVTDLDFLVDKLISSYQSFGAQKGEKVRYIAIDRETSVLAGAWIRVASFVKQGYIDEKYIVRKRNKSMTVEYEAFIGFVINKETAKNCSVEIKESDIICAFNGIIAKIWDRSPELDYPAQEAWFDIDTCSKKEDSDYKSYVGGIKKYIPVKESVIEVFNGIVNAMLHTQSYAKTAFSSGFDKRAAFDEQIVFELGCSSKSSAFNKKYQLTKTVAYQDYNDATINPNFEKPVTVISIGSSVLSQNEKTESNSVDVANHSVNTIASQAHDTFSTNNSSPTVTNANTGDICIRRNEDNNAKAPYQVKVRETHSDNKEKIKKPEVQRNHTKTIPPHMGFWEVLKLIWKFLTTDVRDFGKGNDDNDKD